MELDTVTTIAIGDCDAHGAVIDLERWETAQAAIVEACQAHGVLVAHATGEGITSDQPDEVEEGTAVFVVINVTNTDRLRQIVAKVLRDMGSTSACFATDSAHEPVWATADGSRPVPLA